MSNVTDIKRVKPPMSQRDGAKFLDEDFVKDSSIKSTVFVKDDEPSFMGDSDDSERLDIKADIDEYQKINKKSERDIKEHVDKLVGKSEIELHKIEDNAKVLYSELVTKNAERQRRRRMRMNGDDILDDDDEGFFRSKKDLKFANIQW